ncbi:hypothetical protein DICA4_E00694 [Diutina catenulata]
MAIFRSKSKAPKGPPRNIDQIDVNFSSADKIHNEQVHDPILNAVQEAQPFEQAAFHGRGNEGQPGRRPSYLSQASGGLKDIFGQPIQHQDMSNPTRSRNERPLDTIRGFEYAITGDLGYRDQLETTRLGWGFHEDFHYANLNESARAATSAGSGGAADMGFARPQFAEQAMYQAGNYSASSLKEAGGKKKKKKGGLFGRKK